MLLTVRDALLTALLETLLITGLALLLVRWTFLDPLKRTAKWLRTLRAGETQIPASLPQGEIFDQLNREMTHLARDLGAARAAAAEEAQLRETHASVWTAERLRISLQSKLKRNPLFVVSNREPYMHVKSDRRPGSAGAGERIGDGTGAGAGSERWHVGSAWIRKRGPRNG